MAHTLLREKAIQLRLQGYTYGQIKRELGLPKGTLSYWLHKYPLGEQSLQKLSKSRAQARDIARERYRNTVRERRLKKLKAVYEIQKNSILPLSEKELLIAGLFLYWGEGAKGRGIVSISNTDPKVAKFAFFWMTQILRVPISKIKVGLHIYKDMDVEETIKFWSKVLNLPKEQFNKPYIKKTNREGLTYKSFGHGTCKIEYYSVSLCEQIAMSIKAVSDMYGAKNDLFWYN